MSMLTLHNQRVIDARIEEIKLRTGFSYPEMSLLELAKMEDIRVVVADLSDIGSNISGIIDYKDEKLKLDPRIFINSRINGNRQKFTLAHELGHHFLHEGRKLRVDDLDYSRNDKDTKEESEANYFAASLLVPKQQLMDKVSRGAEVSVIADYFGVSTPVIENRLKWLSLN